MRVHVCIRVYVCMHVCMGVCVSQHLLQRISDIVLSYFVDILGETRTHSDRN